MGKNSHIHLRLESDILFYLKAEARKRSMSLAELCRLKVMKNLQLDRIENLLQDIKKQNERKNRYK